MPPRRETFNSVRRIRTALDCAALFKKRVSDVTNGGSQEIAPLILRPKQYQIDEALAHFRNQVRQIDLVLASRLLTQRRKYPRNRLDVMAAATSSPTNGIQIRSAPTNRTSITVNRIPIIRAIINTPNGPSRAI
jgi:hypothetical protein